VSMPMVDPGSAVLARSWTLTAARSSIMATWSSTNSKTPEGMVEERVVCCAAVMRMPWRRAMAAEGTAASPSRTDAAQRRLFRVTGIAGLASIVLIFVAVVGTRDEPSFTATATQFLAYYRSPDTVATPFRSFLFTVGLVTFVWFVVGLSILLRRAEGEAAWRWAIAMGSGVLFVALGLSGLGNEAAVAFRADDLDPQIARYAFDQGQAAFANGRVALGSFAVCCGWVIVSTRFLPRWLGWLAIASGVGLVLSRVSWTSQIWLVPYLMFWLWVLVVAGLLVRRGGTGGPQRQTG
jgi:hypothetical protein